MCIREQCSTVKESCSETVGAQDPTSTLCAFEGCYFWLATAWSCGLSWAVGEACQLRICTAPPGTGHPKPRLHSCQAEPKHSEWGQPKPHLKRGHLITRKHSHQTHPELPGEDPGEAACTHLLVHRAMC